MWHLSCYPLIQVCTHVHMCTYTHGLQETVDVVMNKTKSIVVYTNIQQPCFP